MRQPMPGTATKEPWRPARMRRRLSSEEIRKSSASANGAKHMDAPKYEIRAYLDYHKDPICFGVFVGDCEIDRPVSECEAEYSVMWHKAHDEDADRAAVLAEYSAEQIAGAIDVTATGEANDDEDRVEQ